MVDITILQKIVDISARLGAGYTFNIKNYLDGHQLQWKNQFVSVIWRSCNWDEDRIEVFNLSSKEEKCFYLDELKSSTIHKISIGRF